ncbi:MAG: D-alanyl-D-alanine carboxypeptidase [Lachnospiraceae bacterium]|nr:D-alanyl-D-alanine carboxypeptidase [Lachnospiraceae bacterium]MCI9660875.1 D-alanyl-D-alanine carboxypeptidase [Lachnospiraceae bacterium]NBH97098.1 D-alanyl-D-alanine carboxypeptidase [Lachnospiraceae bacterium]NBI75147.1 D-alanyl-D-alanine carboxypeptidase [Lachnospiraceae bacterium]RKJ94086.1 D-alanyl-D-alanine carboxypeptidase [Anaerotruncus sp. 1XD22-93]
MDVKKTVAAVIIICVLVMNVRMEVFAAPEELYAQSAVLMDADSGRVLFEKNGMEQRPMASTTKILTCILVLEKAGLGETAEVSRNAASQPKVHLGVRAGEKYYVQDLLYSLMLESHNDAAVILAEHVGGSLEGFAALMNEKAKEIGCADSHFITPNGLDAEDEEGAHSTTAADLAKIMRYCITLSPKKAEFLEITRTSSRAFSDVEGKRSFSCVNHNAFLGMMDGALSGKTGFTGKAGYCYVGALTRDGKTFIVALLACGWPNNKTYKWKDTRKLMEYGLKNYEYRNVWEDIQVERIPVENGIPESGELWDTAYTEAEIEGKEEVRLLLRKDEKVSVEVEKTEQLAAPIEAGQQVGTVRYYLGDGLIREFPIKVRNSVREIDMSWCAEKIVEKLCM